LALRRQEGTGRAPTTTGADNGPGTLSAHILKIIVCNGISLIGDVTVDNSVILLRELAQTVN
jgi:hypothetical protein